MTLSRFRSAVLAVVTLIALLAVPLTSFAANLTTRTPESVTQVVGFGETVGSLTNLEVKDSTNFVTLQTPTNKAYKADFALSVPLPGDPDGLHRYTIQGLTVQANFRGQTTGKNQNWTWLIYNYKTKKWLKLGSLPKTMPANVWTEVNFTPKVGKGTVFADFVDPDTRNILVRLQSSNSKFDADLDYLAVDITSPDLVAAPQVNGCNIFDTNNVWNARVDMLPVDKSSSKYIKSLGSNTGLHPDFGTEWEGAPIGIPYNSADGSTPVINFTENMFWYGDESDLGNYPIPNGFLQEGNGEGDAHILTVYHQGSNCTLYELYAASINGTSSEAGSGAIFDLNSNAMRPDGWTSADAAGLPILPGLVRYDEVQSGRINHALRFTAGKIRDAYIWPASHHASCGGISATNKSVAPMGQRFRLKASVDISGYSPEVQVILTAMKEYGIILADCGSNWYISGQPNAGWDDDMLVSELRTIKGSMFEAVDESSIQAGPDSYAITP